MVAYRVRDPLFNRSGANGFVGRTTSTSGARGKGGRRHEEHQGPVNLHDKSGANRVDNLTSTSSNTLYSGLLPLLAAPHAMTGLVPGIMATGKTVRGSYEVRCQRPNMWALVAQAMGSLVIRMRWADPGFA